MKIEQLELGRLYEITYIPEGSAWFEDNLVGSIVRRVQNSSSFNNHIGMVKATSICLTTCQDMYINEGEYRPLNLKDAARVREELTL